MLQSSRQDLGCSSPQCLSLPLGAEHVKLPLLLLGERVAVTQLGRKERGERERERDEVTNEKRREENTQRLNTHCPSFPTTVTQRILQQFVSASADKRHKTTWINTVKLGVTAVYLLCVCTVTTTKLKPLPPLASGDNPPNVNSINRDEKGVLVCRP